MKKNLTILMLLPQLLISQITLIPDSTFEQKLINYGYDTIHDGQVFTSSINSITSLTLASPSLTNLIGIEDFTSLMSLSISTSSISNIDISNNQYLTVLMIIQSQLSSIDLTNNPNLTNVDIRWNNISSIDLSNNLNLTQLETAYNPINSLDLSNNIYLTELFCHNNQLNSLDLNNNGFLEYLSCANNLITSLDLSNNPLLTNINCSDNPLECLNYQNGNNLNLSSLNALNTNLSCIQVDDSTWSTDIWNLPPSLNLSVYVDSTTYYSTNCGNDCSLLGIDNSTINKFNVYPNPTNDYTQIEISHYPATLCLLDMNGKIVYEDIIQQSSYQLNVSTIEKGIYLLRVGNESNKLIVK